MGPHRVSLLAPPVRTALTAHAGGEVRRPMAGGALAVAWALTPASSTAVVATAQRTRWPGTQGGLLGDCRQPADRKPPFHTQHFPAAPPVAAALAGGAAVWLLPRGLRAAQCGEACHCSWWAAPQSALPIKALSRWLIGTKASRVWAVFHVSLCACPAASTRQDTSSCSMLGPGKTRLEPTSWAAAPLLAAGTSS